MGKYSIIDINNNQILKENLNNICNSKNHNNIFSYTQKIKPLGIRNLIENKFYHNEHQFFFENNKSNLSLIGYGAIDIIEVNELNNLDEAKTRIEEQLNSIIDISDNNDVTVKFLGGYEFDFNNQKTTIWNKFPKGYFILPECMITITKTDAWMTVIKKIKGNDSTESIIENINNLYNNINEQDVPQLKSEQSVINQCQDNIDKNTHLYIINEIINEIKTKNIKKVVYSRLKKIELNKPLNISSAIESLRLKYPHCINFFIKIPHRGTFFGSTPEQLVSSSNNNITTEAIAGTINRGNDALNDLKLENELKNNQKYIEEHKIVIDEIKRLLNPKLNNISISNEPSILKLHNLQHLITKITGTLKNNIHILELVRILHPTPAVAGLPTTDALKLICEYEQHDRGWYSAPIGWVDKFGNGDFCVSLRSGYVIDNIMHIFSGAGIVEKSIPEDEWEETEMKFKTILSIFDKSNHE